MRYRAAIALSLLLWPLISAHAQISVGIGFPGVNIGINVSAYPHLVPVPGYPVYYAPEANWNYFFYDGLYWVYQADNWYASSWYNGPWQLVGPEDVPLFVLRVPVRYYRQPPVYFRGWRDDAPPHWGEHWGRDWDGRRRGWDQWDRRSAPPPAPLPNYQRQYSGDRYPQAPERQHSIQAQHYRYQPREAVTQRQLQPQGHPGPPTAAPQPRVPAERQPSRQPQRQPQPLPPSRQSQEPHLGQPPARSMQQNQAQQQAPRTQPPQTGPQDRGRENRENRAAPQDQHGKNESAPKDRNRENKGDEHGPAPR